MYDISKQTYRIAKRYGLEVHPSEQRFKKIDVFSRGNYIASIGDSRYKDYYVYLKENGKSVAQERARLYYLRHKKDSLKERLAKLLLW